MSLRSPEANPEFILLSNAVGDILGARSVALHLMDNSKLQLDDRALATLVMTAALLHCASRDDEGVTPRALAAYLEALSFGVSTEAIMAQCRLQFVQYAAVELSTLSTARRVKLVQELQRLVSVSPTGVTRKKML